MAGRKARLTRLAVPVIVVAVSLAIPIIAYDQSRGSFPHGNEVGAFNFFLSFLTIAALYSIFTLGLNIQWGYAGVFNFGVLGFFMLGAYLTAIITKAPAEGAFTDYVGGFGPDLDIVPFLRTDQWFPFLVATAAAGAAAGILAVLVAIPTLRLREDYLAIATIGIAELLRRIVIEERGLVNGTRGLTGVPLPLDGLVERGDERYLKLALAVIVLVLVYVALERAVRSPWGRVLMSLREDELTTAASGKNVFAFKTQGFVLGAVIMGIGGSLYAYVSSSLTPEAFTHFFATFLFWAMLILGGSGNNNGAVAGAYVLWGFWTITLQLQGYDLGSAVEIRMAYARELMLGVLIVAVLLLRPSGLLPQERRVSIWVERAVRKLRADERAEGPPPGAPPPVQRPGE